MNSKQKEISVLFFGSTSDSILILEKLFSIHSSLFALRVSAVVTQPPRPVGREKTMTPTPVELWAKQHEITLLTFESNPEKPWLYADEQLVIDALQPVGADLIISASYGIKIPTATISAAKFGGINIHPSILPHWRGADPVPWAILSGDHQTGVSIVTLTESFDEGKILAQEKIPITPSDTSDPLRTNLFTMGADLLITMLPNYLSGKLNIPPAHPTQKKLAYARKFTRDDGFETWETIAQAISDGKDAGRIERKFRALHPWPGIWTKIEINENNENNKTTSEKRLKILQLHLSNGKIIVDEVQLEGKKPVSWTQFHDAYLTS